MTSRQHPVQAGALPKREHQTEAHQIELHASHACQEKETNADRQTDRQTDRHPITQ